MERRVVAGTKLAFRKASGNGICDVELQPACGLSVGVMLRTPISLKRIQNRGMRVESLLDRDSLAVDRG